MTYKEFYNTQRWKATREAYKRHAGGLCERCLAKGLIVPGELVHHKVYLDSDKINIPEIALSFDNLELLCWSCHEQEHERKKTTKQKKRYSVDQFGRVRIAPQNEEI